MVVIDDRRKLETSLENAVDELLRERNDQVYTERQLLRKIRLERKRRPERKENSIPEEVIDYLLKQQIALLVDSAKLNRFQASVLALHIEGWEIKEISATFKIPYSIIRRALTKVRKKIKGSCSPYDGLYEVYWCEVHRYVYRPPQHGVNR